MSQKQTYVVKEGFRKGGVSYPPGASILLTAEEFEELKKFLVLDVESAVLVERDLERELSEVGKELAAETTARQDAEKEVVDLREKLALVERDLQAVRDANELNANELAAAKEQLSGVNKELAAANEQLATLNQELAVLKAKAPEKGQGKGGKA